MRPDTPSQCCLITVGIIRFDAAFFWSGDFALLGIYPFLNGNFAAKPMTLIELHEQKAGADSCRVLAATFLLPVAMAGEDLDRCVWLGSWFVMANPFLQLLCGFCIRFPTMESLFHVWRH